MLKKVLSYFNLTGLPFNKEIPDNQLVLLPVFENALSSLKLLVTIRGIGIMTGKSGSGKSCLVRLLLNSLNTGLYQSLYICHTTVSSVDFYSHLAVSLGL
jgi:general secretion pathway protein A